MHSHARGQNNTTRGAIVIRLNNSQPQASFLYSQISPHLITVYQYKVNQLEHLHLGDIPGIELGPVIHPNCKYKVIFVDELYNRSYSVLSYVCWSFGKYKQLRGQLI